MKYYNYLVLLLCLSIVSCNEEKKEDSKVVSNDKLTSYVNTFTGTDGPGNTYPGAVVPFGMVQLSPDNGLPGWDRIAGYFYPDSTIAGFSHTHLSGTGAGDMYDLLVMPLNSKFTENLTPEGRYRPYSKFSHDKEDASPGYYTVDLLSSGIKAELTTTSRVGFHQYTFPKDQESKIILDLGYSLNWDAPVDTKIRIENDSTISGYRKSKGWAADQRVYFVVKFSKPSKDIQLFKNESSASIEGARKNLKAELNHWNFRKTVNEADKTWENYLSKIMIEGTTAQKELFYTNLYHVYLTPSLHSDVDGAYHAVPVIVDAYFKGIQMDAKKLLEACVASATEKGRQIDTYMELGYVPTGEHHENWSVSKTLEYAYNDWCIAQLAEALGEKTIQDTFSKRANNWRNLYDNSSTFFRPKDETGTFISPFIAKEGNTFGLFLMILMA